MSREKPNLMGDNGLKAARLGVEVSEDVQQVCKWIATEILAGALMAPENERQAAFNNACRRAYNICRSYQHGEGLFQMTAAMTAAAEDRRAS